MEATSVAVWGARLEVVDWGSGEPVVFVQTALTADELLPLASDPALAGYRRILYHRRGYAGSTSTGAHASVADEAADCQAVLTELAVDRAHVVGLSYSCAIGLQLAADVPRLAHTLTLIEPPPVHTPSAPEFRAANDRLITTFQEAGPAAALDAFLIMLVGPDWWDAMEHQLRGCCAQMQRDAGTFFDSDLPALLAWRFGPADASLIDCPVLYVGGTDSGTWFDEVRELMLSWFPHAENAVIDGADHALALTHAPAIARRLADFLQRHPFPS